MSGRIVVVNSDDYAHPRRVYVGSRVHLVQHDDQPCIVADITGPGTAVVYTPAGPRDEAARRIVLNVAGAIAEGRIHLIDDCGSVADALDQGIVL